MQAIVPLRFYVLDVKGLEVGVEAFSTEPFYDIGRQALIRKLPHALRSENGFHATTHAPIGIASLLHACNLAQNCLSEVKQHPEYEEAFRHATFKYAALGTSGRFDSLRAENSLQRRGRGISAFRDGYAPRDTEEDVVQPIPCQARCAFHLVEKAPNNPLDNTVRQKDVARLEENVLRRSEEVAKRFVG